MYTAARLQARCLRFVRVKMSCNVTMTCTNREISTLSSHVTRRNLFLNARRRFRPTKPFVENTHVYKLSQHVVVRLHSKRDHYYTNLNTNKSPLKP